MQVQTLTLSLTLAIATAANLPSVSHASTRYDVILQQLGLQTTQSQITQPQPKPIQLQVTQPKLQKSLNGSTSLPSTARASTRYDVILQQLGLQTTQSPMTQPQITQSQATSSQTTQTKSWKSISTDQARQTFFRHPPALIRVASSQPGVSIPATYEFTLTVPQDAGQPLKAVTVTQAENAEAIKFDISNSKAYTGRKLTASSEIPLASIGGDQPANSGKATIVFDQPVLPGNTVTIDLSAKKNPTSSGIYLFGVTAYPDGENGLGQFLGYGRINFHGNSN